MNISFAIWGAAFVLFLIIEAAVPGLISIWFAAGALIALLTSIAGASLWLQLAVFLVTSVVLLAATKPLAEKYVNRKAKPTNADMIIGKTCQVLEKIDNIASTGAVSVDGKVWTARSENGSILREETKARVLRIEGVKVIVEPCNE